LPSRDYLQGGQSRPTKGASVARFKHRRNPESKKPRNGASGLQFRGKSANIRNVLQTLDFAATGALNLGRMIHLIDSIVGNYSF